MYTWLKDSLSRRLCSNIHGLGAAGGYGSPFFMPGGEGNITLTTKGTKVFHEVHKGYNGITLSAKLGGSVYLLLFRSTTL
jgi:hypothetical protein